MKGRFKNINEELDRMKYLSGAPEKQEELIEEGFKENVLFLTYFLASTFGGLKAQSSMQQNSSDKVGDAIEQIIHDGYNEKNVERYADKESALKAINGLQSNPAIQQDTLFMDYLNGLQGKMEQGKVKHGSKTTIYKGVVITEKTIEVSVEQAEAAKGLFAAKGNSVILDITSIKDTITKPGQITSTEKEIKMSFNSGQVFSEDEYNPNDAIVSQVADSIRGHNWISLKVNIHGSASQIPTQTFGGSNDSLASARACAFGGELKAGLVDSSVEITATYAVGDTPWDPNTTDRGTYHAEQFVEVTLSGLLLEGGVDEVAPETEIAETVLIKILKIRPIDEVKGSSSSSKSLSGGEGGVSSADCPWK